MELIKNGLNEITIRGNIKSSDDYLMIKRTLGSMVDSGSKQINIILFDSISITSSVIGYMVKLIQQDNIQITTQMGDKRLYELLQELSLIELFRAKLMTINQLEVLKK